MKNFNISGRFSKQLINIKDKEIRLFTWDILRKLPEYFWIIPASSTGKYHPEYCLGEGGLVRHTKATLVFAEHIFETKSFTDYEKDCIRAALILHDGLKNGPAHNLSPHTRFDHPLLMKDLIDKHGAQSNLKKAIYTEISDAVASHYGKFNTHPRSPGITLPTPVTLIQKTVHLCDYLASRRGINVDLS